VRDKDFWPLVARLNDLLRQEAGKLADVYVDVPVEDFQPADFIDEGHFAPAGSTKFAAHLIPVVTKTCK
jgi:hypothetical protein